MAIASRLLKDASGGWWGPCAVTVRPCAPDQGFVCSGPCGCAPVCRVAVGYPATQLIAVQIDGVFLDPGGWRIDDYQWVVKQDPAAPCPPACQRLDLELGEPGTWAITYLRGYPIDAAASRAVTALAVQIASDCAQGGDCALDPRTTRLTRQGVTYELTPESDQGSAWLNLPVVAAWLGAVNPNRLDAPLAWWSPEMGYTAETTNLRQAPPGAGGLQLQAFTNGHDAEVIVTGETAPVWISWGDGTMTAAYS